MKPAIPVLQNIHDKSSDSTQEEEESLLDLIILPQTTNFAADSDFTPGRIESGRNAMHSQKTKDIRRLRNSCTNATQISDYARGEKPFTCDMCEKECTTQGNQNTHRRTYTGKKPYACDMYEKKCTTLGDLNKHSLTHTGEKPYSSVMCKEKCATNSGLDKHRRTHTGKKPYKFPICGNAFTDAHYSNVYNEKLTLFNDVVKQVLSLKGNLNKLFLTK
ncbi:Zinc finger protein 677 [Araneus ventricosus]|uniref:Zinc finger protein 677 n=1 Tax=Araneus ventricosus TaxID=182803 RepID=A0A4Y2V229_ARAVE|nr:Zinc finger protein 677 [Araneus ventricosus]